MSRVRAIAVAGSPEAMQRYAIYREAYKRINDAIRDGYALEAITLIESLLSDRLESRASFLFGRDFAFKTLEKLVDTLGKIEVDEEFRALVTIHVRQWKDERNKSLHEMAKLAEGDQRSWAERMAALPGVAKRGLTVLRRVDSRGKKLRRPNDSL